MRTFLAIELSDPVRAELEGQVGALKEALPNGAVRWIDTESVHLTMKFLGEVSPGVLDAVRRKAREISARSDPMQLSVGDFGVFPGMDRPRVLWIGIHEASGELGGLKSALEAGMEDLGFEPERRDFTPHLTVGRVQRNLDGALREELTGSLQRVHVPPIGEMTADELTLFKSDLQPSGAVYTPLEKFGLGGR